MKYTYTCIIVSRENGTEISGMSWSIHRIKISMSDTVLPFEVYIACQTAKRCEFFYIMSIIRFAENFWQKSGPRFSFGDIP
jgi:hypothetical protein